MRFFAFSTLREIAHFAQTWREIMTSLTAIVDGIHDIGATLNALDLKLDEVKARLDEVPVGQVVEQSQIDAVIAAIDDAKKTATRVLDEAGDLAKPSSASEDDDIVPFVVDSTPSR